MGTPLYLTVLKKLESPSCFIMLDFLASILEMACFKFHFQQSKLSLVMDAPGFHTIELLTSSCLSYSSQNFSSCDRAVTLCPV